SRNRCLSLKRPSKPRRHPPKRYRPVFPRTPPALRKRSTSPMNGTRCWKIPIQQNPPKRRLRQGPPHLLLRRLTKLPRSPSPPKNFRLQKSQSLRVPTRSQNSSSPKNTPRLSKKRRIPLRTSPQSFLLFAKRKKSLHLSKKVTHLLSPKSLLLAKSRPFLK